MLLVMRWGSLSLLFVVLLFVSQCSNPTVVPPAAGGCAVLQETLGRGDVEERLQRGWERVQAKIKEGTFGCLQVAYGANEQALSNARGSLVWYEPDGKIFAACDNGDWCCDISLGVPKSSLGQFVRFRVFLIAMTKERQDDATVLCREAASRPAFRCLSNDDCLAILEFLQPVDGFKPVGINETGIYNKQCSISFRVADGEPVGDVDGGLGDVSPDEPLPTDAVSFDVPDTTNPSDASDAGADAGEPSPDTCVDGQTRVCGTSRPPCSPGVRSCEGGVWSDCKGGVQPKSEFCNGLDDDCDGMTDNDCSFLVSGGALQSFDEVRSLTEHGPSVFVAHLIGTGSATFGKLPSRPRVHRHVVVGKLQKRDGQWLAVTPLPVSPTKEIFSEPHRIVADGKGHLFVVGRFAGELSFPDYKATANPKKLNVNISYGDGFVAVLDEQLNWLSVAHIGGEGPDLVGDIAIHPQSGKIFACGVVQPIVAGGANPFPYTYSSSKQSVSGTMSPGYKGGLFVGELSLRAGKLSWLRANLVLEWRSSSGTPINPPRCVFAPDGSLYLVGLARGDARSSKVTGQPGGAYILPNVGLFVAKIRTATGSAFEAEWFELSKRNGTSTLALGDVALGPGLSGGSRIVIVGSHRSSFILGNQTFRDPGHLADSFVAALDVTPQSGRADLRAWSWALGSRMDKKDVAYSVQVGRSGAVFVGGFFESTGESSWGGYKMPKCTSRYECAFLAKISPTGSVLWVATGIKNKVGSYTRGGFSALMVDSRDFLWVGGSTADGSFRGFPIMDFVPNDSARAFVGFRWHRLLGLR